MTTQGLSEEIKKFIIEQINSLEQLRDTPPAAQPPGAGVDGSEVSQELRLSQTSVADRLADLQACGLLIVREDSALLYQYQPQKPELGATVAILDKNRSKT